MAPYLDLFLNATYKNTGFEPPLMKYRLWVLVLTMYNPLEYKEVDLAFSSFPIFLCTFSAKEISPSGLVILLLGALILGNGDGEGKSTLFLVNLLKRKEEIYDYMEICIL